MVLWQLLAELIHFLIVIQKWKKTLATISDPDFIYMVHHLLRQIQAAGSSEPPPDSGIDTLGDQARQSEIAAGV